ncbi:MAG: hypothetical protein QXU46_04180 [Candidatus Bathyarchaeia archaeon]
MVDPKRKEIGDRLRTTKELTKYDLIEIVEWKFKELEGRRKRVLALISENEDAKIRSISKYVFSLDSSFDAQKVDLLRTLQGVGVSIASAILTFYNPNEYCVFDIRRIEREPFGKEPTNLYTTENYLKALLKLKEEAKKHNLSARTVEKAYFKKNMMLDVMSALQKFQDVRKDYTNK